MIQHTTVCHSARDHVFLGFAEFAIKRVTIVPVNQSGYGTSDLGQSHRCGSNDFLRIQPHFAAVLATKVRENTGHGGFLRLSPQKLDGAVCELDQKTIERRHRRRSKDVMGGIDYESIGPGGYIIELQHPRQTPVQIRVIRLDRVSLNIVLDPEGRMHKLARELMQRPPDRRRGSRWDG